MVMNRTRVYPVVWFVHGDTHHLPLLGDQNLGASLFDFPPQQVQDISVLKREKKEKLEREGEDRDRRERERERERRLRLEPAVCSGVCVCVRSSVRRTRAPVRSVPVGWPGGRCVGLRLRFRLALRLALPCVISSSQHYVFHPYATVCYVA